HLLEFPAWKARITKMKVRPNLMCHSVTVTLGTSEKTKNFQIDLAQQKYYLICLKTYMLQIWRIKIEFNMSPKAKIKIIMCFYGSAHICGKTVCLRFSKVFPVVSVRLRDSRRASCICISFTVF